MSLLSAYAAVVAAIIGFMCLVLLSASLPCRSDRTLLVGSVVMAGCSDALHGLPRIASSIR
jgi:hypothetical protein